MKNKRIKGGAGSGRRPGSTPHRAPPGNRPSAAVPSGHYTEQPASRLPGHPRSGIRPADLYPERDKPKH